MNPALRIERPALESAPAVPGDVLSPSQVSSIMDCAYRWHAKKVLKLPESPTPNQILGRAVHAALAANFEQKCETKADLPVIGVLAVYREAWDVLSAETEFHDAEDPDAFGKTGEGLVSKYMEEAAPGIDPAAVEMRVEGVIAGVKVTGYIDLLDVNGCVIDIKTAKARPSSISPMHRFQVATYRYLTNLARGVRPNRHAGENQDSPIDSTDVLDYRAGTTSHPHHLSGSPGSHAWSRSSSQPPVNALQPPRLRLLAPLRTEVGR